MKTVLFITSLAIAFALSPHEVSAATCQCVAPDLSCSATITCSGGCTAWCGSGGNCSASCAGGGGGPCVGCPDEPGGFTSSPSDSTHEASGKLLSMNFVSASSSEVSDHLTEQLGFRVHFLLDSPDESVSIEAHDMPAGELINGLRKLGIVAFGKETRSEVGQSVSEAGQSASNRTITLHSSNSTWGDVALILEAFLDNKVKVTATQPEVSAALDIKDMPVNELLRSLRKAGVLAKAKSS